MSEPCSIEIRFDRRWSHIAPTRVFIQNFVAMALSDQAKADGMAMATGELLENAVKYGVDDVLCAVRTGGESGGVQASVSNFSTERGARDVQAFYDRVMLGDALDAYRAQMSHASTRTDGKSQLGLARIRYETGAEVRLVVTAERQVTFTILVK